MIKHEEVVNNLCTTLKVNSVYDRLERTKVMQFCWYGYAKKSGADLGIFNRKGANTFQEEKRRRLGAHTQLSALTLQK